MSTLETYEALWDAEASDDDRLAAWQAFVDDGSAWRLEGHVGRSAMGLIESGQIALGAVSQTDYWGNYIPSRYEVEPGSKGSVEFVIENDGRVPPEDRT